MQMKAFHVIKRTIFRVHQANCDMQVGRKWDVCIMNRAVARELRVTNIAMSLQSTPR